MALMAGAADLLADRIEFTVPDQDLEIDLRRLPALPRSRFVLEGVRVATPAAGVA